VGPAVSRLKRGDLVVPMVRRPCTHDECIACRAGRQDFCFTGDFSERGIKNRHGFMTEFVVDDERYMPVVPRTLRDVAVLVEPLTIARVRRREALSAMASAASPVTRSRHVSSRPLRFPFGTSFRPSAVIVSTYGFEGRRQSQVLVSCCSRRALGRDVRCGRARPISWRGRSRGWGHAVIPVTRRQPPAG
jgi:hypothetical protein